MLSRRDQRIIAAFAQGERPGWIAESFGISPTRVTQLRQKYHRAWRVYQGETPAQHQAA
jgi:hypothetical protein